MATYVLTIGGATKTLKPGFSITETINGRATLEGAIDSLDGSYRPAMDAEVILTEDGTRIFGGLITKPNESGFGGSSGANAITTRFSAVDFNALADRRYVIDGGFPAGFTLKAALESLVGYLTPYGVSLHASQVTGPTLPLLIYDVKQLTAILDELSTITGYAWRIDFDKKLRMFAPGDQAAPFNISEGPSGNAIGDITVEPTRTEFANQIILLAGTGEKDVSDALGTGNGSAVTFALNYPFVSSFGYVTVNGFNETLGPGATWSYNPATNSVTRTSAPTTGHAIVMPYTAKFPIRVQSPTSPPATPWEKVITAPDVFVKATAQALADGYLARATAAPKVVSFLTRGLGLHPAQTLTIVSSKRNISSGTYLIRDVKSVNAAGNVLDRQVTAIEGTVIQTNPARETLKQWRSGGGGGGDGSTVLPGTIALLYVRADSLGPETRFDNSEWPLSGSEADATTRGVIVEQRVIPSSDDRIDLGYIGDTNRRFKAGYFSDYVEAAVLHATTALYERSRQTPVGEFATFIPTWTNLTVGNGTVSARYAHVGQLAFVEVIVVFGSTTSVTGNVTMNALPVNNTVASTQMHGWNICYDASSTISYSGMNQPISATQIWLLTQQVSGTNIRLSNVTATVPFAWTTSDQLFLFLIYRTA